MTGKLALLGALAALTLAPEASAKMCVRITTVPAKPVAGAPTTIRVTALSIVVSDGRARPGNRLIPLSPQTQHNLRVVSPAGRSLLVRVRRSADRPSVLEGSFSFASAGAWTLSWAAWANNSNAACAGTRVVRVDGR
jgi:hypothetical protein